MRHFNAEPVAAEVLQRMLNAAHAAPSVGLMQPWRFIRITDPALREAMYQQVDHERHQTAEALGERGNEFMALKVEGMRECAELVVVALMDRREPHVFGRRTLPQMDLASASCAIHNMWLAARAEGVGLGWVSLFDPELLKTLLGMPADSLPIAILCIGHVDAFYEKPMLEQTGWRRPQDLETLLMENQWDSDKAARSHSQDR